MGLAVDDCALQDGDLERFEDTRVPNESSADAAYSSLTARDTMDARNQSLRDAPHAQDRVDGRAALLGLLAMISIGLVVALLIVLHFVQPALNPLTRFTSEYVLGRSGWLMKLAFLALATGIALLAYAVGSALRPPARSRWGGTLLAISALGVLGGMLFDASGQDAPLTRVGMIHILSGLVTFLSLIPAMFVITRRLSRERLLVGPYRWLRGLPWIVAILFLAMFFVFGPIDLAGLGQRLFLAAIFIWLCAFAEGLRTGTLSRSTS